MTSQGPDPRWQRPDDPSARPASAQLVDPEDDLPSATYGGDFETTKIPHYGSDIPPAPVPAPAPAPANGYSLLHDPEPLPYVQPHSTAGHALAEPMEIDPIDAEERAKAAARRGTQDLGLLLLRVGIGAIFIAHGLQKAFGWWGGGGIDGFKTALADAGYQHAGILTYALERLRNKLEYTTVGFQLLPERFTLGELQAVYEAVLGRPLDKRNFRRKLELLDILVPLAEHRTAGRARPARLYRLATDRFEKLRDKGILFPF